MEVLYIVGLYHGLAGDPGRGVSYCERALALTDGDDFARSRDAARNALAQLALRGGLDDPTIAVRDAIVGSSTERLWFDLWPTVRALARWWISQSRNDFAAVIVGHLDAHGLTSHQQSFDNLRQDPELQSWLGLGARLDRDELAVIMLEQLALAS
jgi:hypothetical protein